MVMLIKLLIAVMFIIVSLSSGCLKASENKDSAQSILDNTNNTAQQITQTLTPTPTPLPTPRQSIAIRTSAVWTTKAPWDRNPSIIHPENDKPFYIKVTFEITNNGYSEVKIHPTYLSVIYDKARYTPIKGSNWLDNVLPESDLLNTGTIKGSLLYYIPSYAGHTRYEVVFDDRRHKYNVDYTFKS